jgi:hypothetical protein
MWAGEDMDRVRPAIPSSDRMKNTSTVYGNWFWIGMATAAGSAVYRAETDARLLSITGTGKVGSESDDGAPSELSC